MSNNKGSENKNLLNPADLEKVTGGSAWNDDAEEMEENNFEYHCIGK